MGIFENQKTWSASKVGYRAIYYTLGNLLVLLPWIWTMGRDAWRNTQSRPYAQTIVEGLSPERKFQRLMTGFGKSPADLPALRAQSATAAKIWGVGALAFGSMILFGQMGGGALGMRFGGFGIDFGSVVRSVAPVAMGLMAARHAQANWIFRNRRHGNLKAFFMSKDWWPRK